MKNMKGFVVLLATVLVAGGVLLFADAQLDRSLKQQEPANIRRFWKRFSRSPRILKKKNLQMRQD